MIDDKVNSGTTAPGTVVHMHLRDPLVLQGTTIALAGTPATFTVVNVSKAESGDVNGAIQIHLDPLTLAGGLTLPLRAYHEYLTMEMTGGQIATRSTTDTIEDVFIPYAPLYQPAAQRPPDGVARRQACCARGDRRHARRDAPEGARDLDAATVRE